MIPSQITKKVVNIFNSTTSDNVIVRGR